MVQPPRQVRIRRHTLNRLQAQVAVMRHMPRKIIRGQLVLRIQPMLPQKRRPLRQLRPILLRQRRTPLLLRQRVHQHQHVAALLHRHLVLFRLLPTAIHLPIRQRKLPQVMRRKRKVPPVRQRRVRQHRQHLRLQQLRIKEQQHRRRRINHIHRSRIPIRKVLLLKQHRPPLVIGHQRPRRNRLPVRQRTQVRIMLPTHLRQVRHQLPVKTLPLRLQRRQLPLRRIQHLAHGHPVSLPVRPQVRPQVLDRILLRVAHRHMPRHRRPPNLTKRQHRLQARCPVLPHRLPDRVRARHRPTLRKRLKLTFRNGRLRRLVLRHRQVEIPPIHPQIIP